MPAIVDHDARRRQVSLVAARLFAKVGVDSVTVRDIATASGYSVTVVSHYFKGKDQLLLFTFCQMASDLGKRVEVALRERSLQEGLETILPLDEERQTEWKIWMAFWSRATTYPDFERAQRQYTRGTLQAIETALKRWRNAGFLRPKMNIKLEAARIDLILAGIGTQWVYDPTHWPAKRQRLFLARELSLLHNKK
jgi:AcrR family transcriptional regulator